MDTTFPAGSRDSPTVGCPECGEELGWGDEIYIQATGDYVVGCTRCVKSRSAQEWWEDSNEPDY